MRVARARQLQVMALACACGFGGLAVTIGTGLEADAIGQTSAIGRGEGIGRYGRTAGFGDGQSSAAYAAPSVHGAHRIAAFASPGVALNPQVRNAAVAFDGGSTHATGVETVVEETVVASVATTSTDDMPTLRPTNTGTPQPSVLASETSIAPSEARPSVLASPVDPEATPAALFSGRLTGNATLGQALTSMGINPAQPAYDDAPRVQTILINGTPEEGTALPLDIDVPVADQTALGVVLITGLPASTRLSLGTRLRESAWGLLPSEIEGLRIWLGDDAPFEVSAIVRIYTSDGKLGHQYPIIIRRQPDDQVAAADQTAPAHTVVAASAVTRALTRLAATPTATRSSETVSADAGDANAGDYAARPETTAAATSEPLAERSAGDPARRSTTVAATVPAPPTRRPAFQAKPSSTAARRKSKVRARELRQAAAKPKLVSRGSTTHATPRTQAEAKAKPNSQHKRTARRTKTAVKRTDTGTPIPPRGLRQGKPAYALGGQPRAKPSVKPQAPQRVRTQPAARVVQQRVPAATKNTSASWTTDLFGQQR